MKEAAILFNGEAISGRMPPFKPDLRQAVRDDQKTETRRIIKNPKRLQGLMFEGEEGEWCPYGKPGDLRVMIEPLHKVGSYAHYRDDNEVVCSLITGDPLEWRWSKDMLTSIHMPYEAARTATRYTDITAERVQEITTEGIIAEGVRVPVSGDDMRPLIRCSGKFPPCDYLPKGWDGEGDLDGDLLLRVHFASLWDTINAVRGYPWDSNDLVWVVKFKRIDKEGREL